MTQTGKRAVRSTVSAAACFLTSTIVAFAHHSVFADFDRTQEKQYRATVSSFAWTNPHASFQARVDSAGTPTVWLFELPGPDGLERAGWMPDTVKANDSLVIVGFPAKDGSARVSVHRVVLSNGRGIVLDHPFAYQPDYRQPNFSQPESPPSRGAPPYPPK